MSNSLSEVASPPSQSAHDDPQGCAEERESHGGSVLPGTGGIGIECLDASLLQAISCLFPKDHGRNFVASLLQIAVIRQMDIPGIGGVDVAVCVLKSIEVFARQHGYGKDTALRYVDILEALQIVRRYRHADSTELLIPLVTWSPSEQALSSLDALLAESAARAKLQQLAGTVKTRFLLLYGSSSRSSLFDHLHETLTDIQALLDRRLSSSKRSLLQLRIANLKTRLEARTEKGDFWNRQQEGAAEAYAEKGDFSIGSGSLCSPLTTQKGDFQKRSSRGSPSAPAEKGDFQKRSSREVGSTPAREGDLQYREQAQKGDFQAKPESQNRRNDAEEGDFQENLSTSTAQKGDFRGQSGQSVTEKGDFERGVAVASLNDNVITSLNNSGKEDVSVNDATADRYTPKEAAAIGQKLAMFLENSPMNTGGFVNKAKQYTRTVIRAAVIDTLVHQAFPMIDPADERGRPRNAAGWFHDACKKYGSAGAYIPPFVEKWLRTDLSWGEIRQQLDEVAGRYRRYMVSGTASADLVRKFLCQEIGQQVLDEALQRMVSQEAQANQVFAGKPPQSESRGELPAHNELSRDRPTSSKTWMDEYEAEALVEEIQRDAGQQGVTARIRQEYGVYVVDILVQGCRVPMKNTQAWRTHYAKVQEVLFLQQQQREQGGQHGTNG